jgi:polysaccharide biosynthesis transport protein
MRDLTRRGAKNRTLEIQDETSMVQALVPYHLSPAAGEEVEDVKSVEYLRTYWHAVRRNIWLVAGLTIFATLAVAVYEIRQPDQYEAQARIEIGRENASAGLKGTADSSGGSSEDSVYFNTQLQILTSSALLRRVVKTLDLEHNDALLHPTLTSKRSVWQRLLNLNGKEDKGPAPKNEVLPTTSVAAASLREDAGDAQKLEPYVEVLMRGLKAEPIKETRTDIKETRLIDISFYHNDPQIAARVVNAVADVSAYMNLERKSESGAVAAEFLQKRIAELQSQIRGAEEQLHNYAGKNQIISLDASQNTVVERLAGLNRELLEAENERSKADAAYKAALAPDAAEAMAVEITNQNNIQESKLAELRQRRVQLLVENTEEWPEVKEIDKQIVEVENQIRDRRASAAANIRKALETRYRQAVAREHSLRGAFNEQRNLTIAQNQAAINYKIMQQEIDTNKGILQSLLQHSKENDIAQAGLLNSVHVIDYATVPDQPVGPKRLRTVGLAFVFSLGLAIGWVLVRENFDNTFRSISDVEKKSRVPALSIVPSVGGATRHGLFSSVRPLALDGNGRAEGHPELLLGTPNPLITEVYRQLRASLLLSRDGSDLRSLLVTSSLPGEGKTTTAINTAVSLAESGANVLLIDGDLRRPSLHRILEVNNEDGLSRALSDGLDGSELFSIIKRTEVSGLSLLTSGPQLKNSGKLLDHEKLRQLFATLGSRFTHMVIDSPPIVPFADSLILGAEVDGVLMVVQGGKSPQEIVLRSMKLLDDVDAVILGVVLNNTKLQPLDTYYQTYCQQYYQSAEGKAAGHSAEIS